MIDTSFDSGLNISNVNSHFLVENVFIRTAQEIGVYIVNCTNGKLLNNTVDSTVRYYGIHILNSSIDLYNNVVEHVNDPTSVVRAGIYLRYVDHSSIKNNHIMLDYSA